MPTWSNGDDAGLRSLSSIRGVVDQTIMDTAARVCSQWGQSLSMADSYTLSKRGKPYTYPYCKPCHRSYLRAHYQANRQQYIDRAGARNERIRGEPGPSR